MSQAIQLHRNPPTSYIYMGSIIDCYVVVNCLSVTETDLRAVHATQLVEFLPSTQGALCSNPNPGHANNTRGRQKLPDC